MDIPPPQVLLDLAEMADRRLSKLKDEQAVLSKEIRTIERRSEALREWAVMIEALITIESKEGLREAYEHARKSLIPIDPEKETVAARDRRIKDTETSVKNLQRICCHLIGDFYREYSYGGTYDERYEPASRVCYICGKYEEPQGTTFDPFPIWIRVDRKAAGPRSGIPTETLFQNIREFVFRHRPVWWDESL